MPFQYQGFCYETLEQATIAEIDNGVLVVGESLYSPASYSLGTTSSMITYLSDSAITKTLTRAYPSCADVGSPSITGMSLSDSVALNIAVLGVWSLAYAFKLVRRAI